MRAAVSLDPQTLLSAYAQGAFPMADRDGVIRWYTADPRGIIPLDDFHIPRTLRQAMKQRSFEIRINSAFELTMRGCMENRTEGTWINQRMIEAYVHLHRLGYAHSIEAWLGDELAGGLYGVSLGAAFFGESMFHRAANASKIALVHLVERLRERKFELLDTQATTPHLQHFGCTEIPATEYDRRLHLALQKECQFD